MHKGRDLQLQLVATGAVLHLTSRSVVQLHSEQASVHKTVKVAALSDKRAQWKCKRPSRSNHSLKTQRPAMPASILWENERS